MGLFSRNDQEIINNVNREVPFRQAMRDGQSLTEFQDCASCRLMGSSAFVGLGAYTLMSGRRQLELQRQVIEKSGSMFGYRARLVSIYAMSVGLIGIGWYRMNS